MKCRTIREIAADVNCHPPYVTLNSLGRRVIASGTIICQKEFPLADCVSLVLNGLAVAEDDECRLACNRTDAELAAAKVAMDKLLAGEGVAGLDFDDNDYEDD
jgi:hypothetical protein